MDDRQIYMGQICWSAVVLIEDWWSGGLRRYSLRGCGTGRGSSDE